MKVLSPLNALLKLVLKRWFSVALELKKNSHKLLQVNMETKWFWSSKRWWCTESANKPSLCALFWPCLLRSESIYTISKPVSFYILWNSTSYNKTPNIPQTVGRILFLIPTPFKTCINSAIVVVMKTRSPVPYFSLISFAIFSHTRLFFVHAMSFRSIPFLGSAIEHGDTIFFIYLNFSQRRYDTMKSSSLNTWSPISQIKFKC